MVAAGWGRIVTISSSSAQSGAPNMAHYAASKGGVISLTKALAVELARRGVTVNTIAPGRIDTERIREVWPDGPTEADLATIPMRRLGTPREVGDVVCFLASDRASYVTGTLIQVDGGMIRSLL